MRVLLLCAWALACSDPLLVQGDAGSDLSAVQEAFFQWHQQQTPEYSTDIGLTKVYNDKLDDMSIEALDTLYNATQGFLNTTLSIDRNELTRPQQYSYDIFVDSLTTLTSNYLWRQYGSLTPLNFMEAFYLDLQHIIDVTPFKTKDDFENYITRLESRPLQIDQMMNRMTEAVKLGITNNRVSMDPVPGQISKVTEVAPVQSLLFKPFNETLNSLDVQESDRQDMRSRALQALQKMWSKLDQLGIFVQNNYNQSTRATDGVGGFPSGKNFYRACLKWHLSVDTAPSAVHNTGLKEVERISQQMKQVMTRQGFNGTISQYFTSLKADPRFHKNSSEELLADFKTLIYDRIYPKLGQLFKDIPPNKVVVKQLPYDGPYGMYVFGSEDGSRPGTFYVNLMRPQNTNSFSMVSLTLHETVPGHHLQNLFQSVAKLPNFQRHIYYGSIYSVPFQFPFYTAYTEGWALYAEYLGEEMGVYQNDYELMGRYSDEIFRAGRLVVDTGIHYMGWSRQKAIDFMSGYTAMHQSEIEIEIDRYITWPGQACAYKIGELKIKELRARAAAALGSSFDVRAFHSLLLNMGPVPLTVMETMVDDYIADQRQHIIG